MFGVHFHNSPYDNRNWVKKYDNLTKQNSYNHKPNALIKTMVHRSNICYSKMFLEKKTEKRINNFL